MAGILVKNQHKGNQKGKHSPYIHTVLLNEVNTKILRTGVFKCWYDFSKPCFLEVPGPKSKHASYVCWKYRFRNNTKIFYQESWLIQNVSVSSCCSLYYFMYVYYVNWSVNMQGTPCDLLLYLQTWSFFFVYPLWLCLSLGMKHIPHTFLSPTCKNTWKHSSEQVLHMDLFWSK